MRGSNERDRLLRRIWVGFVVLSMLTLDGSVSQVSAHGGEDHGDKKVVATTENGVVSRSARVGDFELLLKHPALVPDTQTSARLFMTHFATNEAASSAEITAEIEGTNGAVAKIPVEKTDAGGSYVLAIPALSDGDYTFRATLTINGKAETATLSGISVAHEESAAVGGSTWSQTILMALLLLIGALLFGGLVYLAIRTVRTGPMREEAIAA